MQNRVFFYCFRMQFYVYIQYTSHNNNNKETFKKMLNFILPVINNVNVQGLLSICDIFMINENL